MVTNPQGAGLNFFVRLAPWSAVLFLTSCGPAELDGPLAAVRVYGQVTTSVGTPVAGAPVALAWRPSNTCDQEVFTIAYDTTDAQGQYAATRSFDFPGAEDTGNMFQFNRDFEEDYCGIRDLDLSRSLNPDLQSFDRWLAVNASRIPLE